jgi:hypothetical protein
MDPETFAVGHGKPLLRPWNIRCGDRKPRMHGVKPLHVRKGEMHACKIREPRDTKRWTLVETGYYLAVKLAPRAVLAPLLAAVSVTSHGAAHASKQFVRSEWFYEIGNHVASDCLRLRPLVRIGGHENGGDRTIRGDQVPM